MLTSSSAESKHRHLTKKRRPAWLRIESSMDSIWVILEPLNAIVWHRRAQLVANDLSCRPFLRNEQRPINFFATRATRSGRWFPPRAARPAWLASGQSAGRAEPPDLETLVHSLRARGLEVWSAVRKHSKTSISTRRLRASEEVCMGRVKMCCGDRMGRVKSTQDLVACPGRGPGPFAPSAKNVLSKRHNSPWVCGCLLLHGLKKDLKSASHNETKTHLGSSSYQEMSRQDYLHCNSTSLTTC
jgi:hypothetical protein